MAQTVSELLEHRTAHAIPGSIGTRDEPDESIACRRQSMRDPTWCGIKVVVSEYRIF